MAYMWNDEEICFRCVLPDENSQTKLETEKEKTKKEERWRKKKRSENDRRNVEDCSITELNSLLLYWCVENVNTVV
jgi:hypothetical protein